MNNAAIDGHGQSEWNWSSDEECGCSGGGGDDDGGSNSSNDRLSASDNDCSIRSDVDSCPMTPMTDLSTSPLVSKIDNKVPIILANDRRRKSSLHVNTRLMPLQSEHRVGCEVAVVRAAMDVRSPTAVMVSIVESPVMKAQCYNPVAGNGLNLTTPSSCTVMHEYSSFSTLSSGHRARDYGILVLSALYAKLLVVLGISLPMSEIISPMIPTSFYVGFYLYLYFGCILFLLYAYVFLLRPPPTTTNATDTSTKTKANASHYVSRTLSWIRGADKQPTAAEAPDPVTSNRVTTTVHCIEGPPLSCGSFYLRAGAIAFGIGSMIYSGLEFVQFFEFNRKSFCYKLVYAVTPLTQMTFTFVQLYFIFLNSKMRAYKYKNVARFGLMHMVGTNLCIWLLTVIMESKFEILRLADPSILKDEAMGFNATTIDDYEVNFNDSQLSPMAEVGRYTRCRRRRVLGKLVQNISPLLFPCSIQYSLICAAICFMMWKNVSRSRKCVAVNSNNNNNGSGSVSVAPSSVYFPRHHQHYRVDCTGSIKGLFSGILILVTVIISVILYFVLINKEGYKEIAIREAHLVEMAIYLLATPVPLVAMWRIRKFRYHIKKKDVEVDNVLLVFAQTGIYLFSIFSMIGGHLSPDGLSLMVFGSSAVRIVQATVQTVFILDASHRTTRTSVQAQTRPGRELITFLLVCNFAMWLICTLWIGRSDSHPVQLEFYGFWGWTIISRFCSPLSIFFRFHSTVCLCEVWKKLYKYKHASERTYSTNS